MFFSTYFHVPPRAEVKRKNMITQLKCLNDACNDELIVETGFVIIVHYILIYGTFCLVFINDTNLHFLMRFY